MTADVKRARLYDVFRGAAIARVGGLEVPVDSAGRFACRVPMGGRDTVEVVLTNRFGRSAVTRLRMPTLDILEPRGELLMPFVPEVYSPLSLCHAIRLSGTCSVIRASHSLCFPAISASQWSR